MNCDRHPVRITAAQPGRRHRAGTGRSVRFLRGYVHASPTAAAADTGQDSPDEQDGAQPTTSDSGDSAPEGTDTTSGSAPEDSAAESDDAGDLIDPRPSRRHSRLGQRPRAEGHQRDGIGLHGCHDGRISRMRAAHRQHDHLLGKHAERPAERAVRGDLGVVACVRGARRRHCHMLGSQSCPASALTPTGGCRRPEAAAA